MNTRITQNKHGDVVTVDVILSERNLRALLLKRAGHPPNSACALQRLTEDDVFVTVMVEDDATHYHENRPEAGEMYPDTEEQLGTTSIESLLTPDDLAVLAMDDDDEPNPYHQGI